MILCTKCNSELPDSLSRCPKCGAYVSSSELSRVRSQIQTTSEILSSKHLYYVKLREIYSLFEFENLLRKERNRILSLNANKKIIEYLNTKVTSAESAKELIELYQFDLHRDLIEDLKKLSFNHKTKALYLSRFIEFNIVEKAFPHARCSNH